MYFLARTEGRISYGHLGRTNSCLTCLAFNPRDLYYRRYKNNIVIIYLLLLYMFVVLR